MTRMKETGPEDQFDSLRMFMEKAMGGAAKCSSKEEQRAQGLR